MARYISRTIIGLLLLLNLQGCVSDSKDLLDLVLNPPSRKNIDKSRTGVSNFFVNREFGDINEQFANIRNDLGLRYVRVLFAWTNDVQPSPASPPNYNFYDAIVAAVPPGVDILVTVVHAPDWMSNPANWTTGNPRSTWVERWFAPLVGRYAGHPRIVGWQIWNEPDWNPFPSDAALDLINPDNYIELLALGSSAIRSLDPGKQVVMAATRSIQQGGALSYNKALRDRGAEDLADIWAVHFYGKQYEKVVKDVRGFIRNLRLPIWITESGEVGPDKQLAYVETTWPFLDDEFGGKIERFYYYQYGETVPPENNFGLRMNGPVFVSDLYNHLAGEG